MNKLKEKIIYLFEKIKLTKRLKIFIILFIFLLIFIVYFAVTKSPSKKENTSNITNDYASYLETKLQSTLVKIKNIGDVKVTISLENGIEYVYAEETESKTTSSGTTTTTSLILVSGEPILIKEIYPKIKGIIVVASGAKDVGIKLNILEAIQTVLDVPNEKITILN